MPVPVWLTSLISPVTQLIDQFHMSPEEKTAAKAALVQMQNGVIEKTLEYERSIVEAQSKVIIAEAQGETWIQRAWRPLTMMIFAGIVAWNFAVAPILSWLAMLFGSAAVVPHLPLPSGFWVYLSTGLGGYIVGRSGEKIVQTIKASDR